MRDSKIFLSLSLLLGMTGCSTLGSNVSGNWSCEIGQEGGCPTTHEIDEQILAGQSGIIPAVTPKEIPQLEIKTDFIFSDQGQGGDKTPMPTRAADRVGRITLMAFVDDASGIYHERSIIYAVMEEGKWLSLPHDSVKAKEGKGPSRTFTFKKHPKK